MPIDWLVVLAALTSGLLGGLHCAAMCGGIATGFSAAAPAASGWTMALQANLGRVGGYVLAGAIVGAFGHGLVGLFGNPWLGFGLRMLVGLMLVLVALRLAGRGDFGLLPRGSRLWSRLQPLQRRLLPADTAGKRIALGMLWGWLPCGLSLSLLTVAWMQASAAGGALTMAAFGLGTLPVMLPLTWSGQRVGRWLQRPRLRALAAGLVLAAGLLTLAGPWLMRVPALHGPLSAIGCLPPPR